MQNGKWIGFYNYDSESARHNMEMSLSVSGSTIVGIGTDDISRFRILGTVIGENINWIKSYDTHSIEYRGCLENGKIWGTWSGGFLMQGGFMLWPRKYGSEEQRKQPEEKPIEERQPASVDMKRLFDGVEVRFDGEVIPTIHPKK
jgi:hypothetical protein